jgi:hypothetical protein
MLKLNKIYYSLKKVGGEWHAGHIQSYFYHDCIRFYENGIVIMANTDNLKSTYEWFYKGNDKAYLNTGTYELDNHKIKIRIPVAIGEILFDGTIGSDCIILFKRNIKTNTQSMDCFEILE